MKCEYLGSLTLAWACMLALPPQSDAHNSLYTSQKSQDPQVFPQSHLMPFEEWRKITLEREGQSLDSAPRARPRIRSNTFSEPYLGDELGEGDEQPPPVYEEQLKYPYQQQHQEDVPFPTPSTEENKYQRTLYIPEMTAKSSKERFNYASYICAALFTSNPEAKGASAILSESKDQYMLNKCKAEKYFVVELCDDILVDTVALANYEFFSSMFKDFRVSVSDRYPPKASSGWKVLGEYQAQNVRDVQVFHVSNPLIWTRYIRVDILSHYGNEYFCPLSLFRVHGTTMMEEYKREEDELLSEESSTPLPESVASGAPSDSTINLSFPKIVIPTLSNFVEENAPSSYPKETAASVKPRQPSQAKPDPTTPVSPLPTLVQPSVCSTAIKFADIIEPMDRECAATHVQMDSTFTTRSIPETATSSNPKHDENGYPYIVPSAGTQESIFKTIMKKLSVLEQNVTLSYKYLEEQSRVINEIFSKIEHSQKRQIWSALNNLNETALAQLNILRNTYEFVWQTSIHEMKAYRDHTNKQIYELSRKVHILADEVLFEKRLGIAQLFLLLALIVIIGSSHLVKT
ncbi:hypothetical protein K493DRAFT_405422, partial [Basidiobolus meristosporus CBS 931.73]